MLQKNPMLAVDYLNEVLATGDEVDLMLALRYISNAFGGVQEIARKAEANPNNMDRMLSERGNPSLDILRAILSTMGLRLVVQPVETDES